MESAKQLKFKLLNSSPYSFDSFIPHSGVCDAYDFLTSALDELERYFACDEQRGVRDESLPRPPFYSCSLVGRKGVGKKHLALASANALLERTKGLAQVALFDFCADMPNAVSGADVVRELDKEDERNQSEMLRNASVFLCPEEGRFVSEYEFLRTHGGIVITLLMAPPEQTTQNPHILSRLKSGPFFELNYPAENELNPIVAALLERHNLRLTSRAFDYLLPRLPRDGLSVTNICAKISDFCFEEQKSAGLTALRDVLNLRPKE